MDTISLTTGAPAATIQAYEIRDRSNVSHTGHLDSVVIEVAALTGTLAITGRLEGSDAAGYPLAYEDMGAGEAVAGGTAIDAVGLYRIPADQCDVILTLTGTSATVHYSAVHGG